MPDDQVPDDPRAQVPGPGAAQRPYIKQASSRRGYDLLLVVPFLCIGASIGTVALSSGVFRHVALVFAFLALFCWIRAGVVTTKSAHSNWLLGMWGAVVLFMTCGLFARLTG